MDRQKTRNILSQACQEEIGAMLSGARSGETLWILGDQVTFKADGERDGLTLFESTIGHARVTR